jgi:transcriptional regulator
MYIPEYFKEIDPERISAFITGLSFGMLITSPSGGLPFVSHLPFLFDRYAGTQGKLFGHIARANPQWQHWVADTDALVVFQGPHAYVSPSWYSSPGVPTWNYAVVHLYGKLRCIKSESALGALLEQLTRIHEAHMPTSCKSILAGEQRSKLLNMIVGFEIEITDIQAKFKLSQNRPLEDQQRVLEKLSQSSYQTETAVAKLMSEDINATSQAETVESKS